MNKWVQGGQSFSKTKFQAFPGFFPDFWTIFQGALQHFQGLFTNTQAGFLRILLTISHTSDYRWHTSDHLAYF